MRNHPRRVHSMRMSTLRDAELLEDGQEDEVDNSRGSQRYRAEDVWERIGAAWVINYFNFFEQRFYTSHFN